MMQLSSVFFGTAFFSYLAATILYVVGLTGRKMKAQSAALATFWTKWGYIVVIIGVITQALAIATRGIYGGYTPVSNMFEYMSFWAFTIMLAFVIINAFYKVPVLGAFVAPIGLVILAYASVFPRDSKPLIPALQSYWLNIHVTTAALGEGILTISFAAGLMYLLVTTDLTKNSRTAKFLEFTVYLFFALLSFVLTSLGFRAAGYAQIVSGTMGDQLYHLPPFIGPTGAELGTAAHFLGVPLPLFDAPGWMHAADAGMQFNTILITIIASLVLYAILRLIARKPLSMVIQKWVSGLDSDMLDELSYRAIAIGYPVFTLGALVFAMIWAQEAWGSYWSWDPKETWALITWLYYTAYLHFRLQRGWEGKKTAWMAVLGFVVILFLLVGVNLVISGLHSYAKA
ncbi:c-type cytochrome biogenesis protein CcsB [Tumebacillus flagellatus]|uniref:Cytochrome C biogenesis protein n=1 Tax=Tumebacillus flagellatus TaxID=1157490 RepID=A0A074MF07_9BACL|nr:c-type cytochrome biogenesis protein CcsB [Tumebacillus flagellatus]KEO84372.1 cytochrome C biogenesis protein [Tumebacillus flagellatus]